MGLMEQNGKDVLVTTDPKPWESFCNTGIMVFRRGAGALSVLRKMWNLRDIRWRFHPWASRTSVGPLSTTVQRDGNFHEQSALNLLLGAAKTDVAQPADILENWHDWTDEDVRRRVLVLDPLRPADLSGRRRWHNCRGPQAAGVPWGGVPRCDELGGEDGLHGLVGGERPGDGQLLRLNQFVREDQWRQFDLGGDVEDRHFRPPRPQEVEDVEDGNENLWDSKKEETTEEAQFGKKNLHPSMPEGEGEEDPLAWIKGSDPIAHFSGKEAKKLLRVLARAAALR